MNDRVKDCVTVNAIEATAGHNRRRDQAMPLQSPFRHIYMRCGIVVTFYLLSVAFKMPQSTPAPTTGRSAVLHEITTEPTSQAMTTSIDQPRVANPWGPTPAGFFVVPSLFQKDLERLAVNNHRQQKAGPDTGRAEMTVGTTDVRVLIKNLEICARHLGPHEPLSRSGETIDVMLSCKEALSSLFRWRQSQEMIDRMANLRNSDSCIAASDPQNVQLDPRTQASHKLMRRSHGTGDTEKLPSHEVKEQGASIAKLKSAKSVKTMISSAEQAQITEKLSKSTKRCQSTVCEQSKLKKRCQKSWDLGQTSFDRLCKICFPRNEALIHTHCLNQERKEKAAFFFLAAALLLSIVILATVVFVKDRRRKRKARMSNEHGASATSSRLKPVNSSGLQSLIQCKETFANWRGSFQRMSNWTTVQKFQSWMSREKPSSDVENARESSCDSFKPEEMLMSPFDYAPGTGKYFSSDQSVLSARSMKGGHDNIPLHTPAALIKALTPPQLPPLKVPILRLFARTSSVDQEDRGKLDDALNLNRTSSLSRTASTRNKSSRRLSSRTA